MKSKTSYFNSGIFIESIKRFWWISLLYFGALFMAVPYNIITINDNIKKYPYRQDSSVQLINNLFNLTGHKAITYVILIFPVLITLFLFRYLHSRNASDMIHSLPVNRKTIYISKVLSGLIMLLLPVIIISIICILIRSTLNMSDYYNIKDVITWFTYMSLYSLVFFSVCIFWGMLVGMSTLQGVLTYLSLMLPVALLEFINQSLGLLLYGYHNRMYDNNLYLSPIGMLLDSYRTVQSTRNIYLYIYGILSILILIAAYFIYKKRNVEYATEAIAFTSLNSLFKYIVTFCTMQFCGMYLTSIHQSSSQTRLFTGYLIGAVIGYFGSEMLINKSVKVLRNYRGFLFYSVAIILIITGIKLDIIGFEKKVPKTSDVSFVCLDAYNDSNSNWLINNSYKSSADIDLITKLHKKLTIDKRKLSDGGTSLNLYYKLKNGKVLRRDYYYNENDYKQYIKPLYESDEYKKINFPCSSIPNIDVEKISLYGNNSSISAFILGPEQIKQFIDAYKFDVKEQTYGQIKASNNSIFEVNFLLNDKSLKKYEESKTMSSYYDKYSHSIRCYFYSSYRHVKEWCRKNNFLTKNIILSSDIVSLDAKKIGKVKDFYRPVNLKTLYNNSKYEAQKIVDKNQIDRYLDGYSDRNQCGPDENYYVVKIQLKDNRVLYYLLSYTDLSYLTDIGK